MTDPAPPPPAPPPSHSAASGFGDKDDHLVERRSLRDYYIILRERLWIALPLALLVSVSVGYYQSRETPMYASTATMELAVRAQQILTSRGITDNTVQTPVDLNNYINQLRSGQLRNRVLAAFSPEELVVLQRPYVKELPPGSPLPGVSSVVPQWEITLSSNSSWINVTERHRDPDAAALIANKVIEQFRTSLTLSISGVDEGGINSVKQSVSQKLDDWQKAQKKLADFSSKNGIGLSFTNAVNLTAEKLNRAENDLAQASGRVRQLQIPIDQIEAYRRENRDLTEIADIKNDVAVIGYKKSVADLKTEQTVLAQRWLFMHPGMIAIDAKIQTAEKSLIGAIDHAEASLQTSLAQAHTAETSAREQRDAARQAADKLTPLAGEYATLEKEVSAAEGSYTTVLARFNELNARPGTESVPVTIRDPAVASGRPYAPDLSRITRTCVGLGILVFIGVAVGLSFIDDRIKSAWDVEHYVGVNLLGIIPDLSALKDEEKYTMVLNNRQVPGAESFLSVYSAVKIHSKLDFPKSLLITSTIPGEGKTLISSNLAGSFARHGKKTLLIDCDLRRPMMHRHFRQENKTGLITWYEGGAKLDGDLPTDPLLGIIKVGEGLSLLCSGGRSKSPTEILESQAFGQLISRLKQFYDLVVIDSPPLGAVTDSLLIAARTDEVIYVCRFNRAYRKHIRLYVKALRSGRNEILGVVLNGLSPRRIEYYSNYRYYRSYKKYYGAQT